MLKSPSNLGPLAPSPSSHRIIRRASRGRAVAATALTTTTPVTAVPRRGGLGAGRMGRGHGARHGAHSDMARNTASFWGTNRWNFTLETWEKTMNFSANWEVEMLPCLSCISPKQHDKYMIWYGCGSKLWYPVEYQIADRWTFRSLFPQIPKFGIGGFDSSPYIYVAHPFWPATTWACRTSDRMIPQPAADVPISLQSPRNCGAPNILDIQVDQVIYPLII